jgi:hypothetical protein
MRLALPLSLALAFALVTLLGTRVARADDFLK